jgi:hypothetical protein
MAARNLHRGWMNVENFFSEEDVSLICYLAAFFLKGGSVLRGSAYLRSFQRTTDRIVFESYILFSFTRFKRS